MPIKVILFDFGGTLDSNGLTWLSRFQPIYAAHGIRFSLDKFASAFYSADDNLASRYRLAGLGLEKTLRLQVHDVLETLAPDRLADAGTIAGRFLLESRGCLLNTQPLLKQLSKRFSLGIVSNFYGNLESVLESEGLRNFFGTVADSGAVGCLKPEPGIFLHALRALGASPAEALMVGDSIERDMKGAERLGMRHAWLRGTRPSDSACCLGAHVLSSLGELGARLTDLSADIVPACEGAT